MNTKTIIFSLVTLLIADGIAYAQPQSSVVTLPSSITAPVASNQKTVGTSQMQALTSINAIPVSSKVPSVMVKLYADPNLKARIIEEVNLSERVTPIFDNGEWVKMGDTTNGNVGWMNKAERQKAVNAAILPRIDSITINVSDNYQVPTTKPEDIKITVYRNGKKLSDEEAKALYEQFQKDQIALSREMNKMISQTIQDFQKTMNQAMKFWDDPKTLPK